MLSEEQDSELCNSYRTVFSFFFRLTSLPNSRLSSTAFEMVWSIWGGGKRDLEGVRGGNPNPHTFKTQVFSLEVIYLGILVRG